VPAPKYGIQTSLARSYVIVRSNRAMNSASSSSGHMTLLSIDHATHSWPGRLRGICTALRVGTWNTIASASSDASGSVVNVQGVPQRAGVSYQSWKNRL
jgi:hypothetical protein